MDKVEGGSNNDDIFPSQIPQNLPDILAALDDLGVPDEFLSPAERAERPVQVK